MNSGLKNRIERIQEQLNPTPPELICVVIRRFDPCESPEAVRPPLHYVGRFGVALFLGGTAKERLAALKRLRANGEYDTLLECSQPAIGEGEAKAIEGETGANGEPERTHEATPWNERQFSA